MNQIANLVSEGLVDALGWTLLHSLWQGTFVALLLSLLLVLLHRRSAQTRYATAGTAMLFQLLLSVGTFAYYYSPEHATATQATSLVSVQASAILPASSFWADPLAVAKVYFEQHLPLLVALWLLGLLLMLIRFMGGIAYTQRLRSYKASVAREQWQQRVNTLAQQLGIKKAVQLVESALVQVPIAIGVAKPVILFPIGAFAGLSQAQIEAILAHELAHISRKDYLFNLLQSVVDIVFFYHPAMWWLSGVVRAERENCCDDVAVALCGDTLTYACALTELEAMRMPGAPGMALAFSGKRGSLMSRIKRLVGQPPMKPSFSESFAVGLALLTVMLVLSFGATAAFNPSLQDSALVKAAKETLRNSSAAGGATDAKVTYVAQDTSGNKRNVVIITNKKGKVKELYVDGKRIPKRDLNKYKNLIDQRLQAAENAPKAPREEAALLAQQASKVLEENTRHIYLRDTVLEQDRTFPAPPAPPAPPSVPLPPLPEAAPPAPPAPPAGASAEELKAYKREVRQFEQEVRHFEKEVEMHNQSLVQHENEVVRERVILDSAKNKLMTERHRARAEEARARQEAVRQQVEARRSLADAQRQEMHDRLKVEAEQRRERHDEIKEELVKDGIIEQNSSNLNIHLNNDELYINGKKQPKQVYDKYVKLLKPNK